MNVGNILKTRLLAIGLLCVAVVVPVSVSAQKQPKEPKEQKKQTEQTVSKQEKEPKTVKEPKEKEPKKQAEPTEKEPKPEKEKAAKKEKSKNQQTVETTLISADEVPDAVSKAYKKRYASATDPVWNFYKDKQLYTVSCIYKNIPTEISYTEEGVWTEILEDFPIGKLSPACMKTINTHYQDYKLNSVKKQVTSTKNDLFIVSIFEKQNIKKKLETTVYLDLSGKYIRSDAPTIAEESEQSAKKEKSKNQAPVENTLISSDKLPAAILKAYKKRYASATDPVWNFYKDKQLYTVSCVYKNIPTDISYKEDGVWVETLEVHSLDKLSTACIKTINMYYQDYKLNSVKKQLTGTKDDAFIVGIFESHNVKKKLETKIYLELSGGYIRAEDPVEEEQIPTQTEQSDKKQVKEDKKIDKGFSKDAKLDEKSTKLTGSELPSSIQRWVKTNYPEYLYRDISYGEDDEFEDEGNLYKIFIQRSGINQPYATVWFTRNGDFLKLEDNFKDETATETSSGTSGSRTSGKSPKENEKNTAKEEEYEVEEERLFEIEESEVKSELVTAFKTKYPRAKDVSWTESESGNWTISFTDQSGKNTAKFTSKSEWVETKTLLPDINKIPSAIRNYIVKNHPKKQIMQGWTVRSAEETKPYYIVELYTKKGKETEYLEFLQNGKLKE